MRSRMFLLHGTEGYPQDPPGCPENQSPHPDTEAAGPAIFPSQEPETMDFICGPFLIVMILMVLSMFLWNVTFEGNNRYTDDALMTYLEKAGIHPGF